MKTDGLTEVLKRAGQLDELKSIDWRFHRIEQVGRNLAALFYHAQEHNAPIVQGYNGRLPKFTRVYSYTQRSVAGLELPDEGTWGTFLLKTELNESDEHDVVDEFGGKSNYAVLAGPTEELTDRLGESLGLFAVGHDFFESGQGLKLHRIFDTGALMDEVVGAPPDMEAELRAKVAEAILMTERIANDMGATLPPEIVSV